MMCIEKIKKILRKLDIIDKNAKMNSLTAHERNEQKTLRDQLRNLLKQGRIEMASKI